MNGAGPSLRLDAGGVVPGLNAAAAVPQASSPINLLQGTPFAGSAPQTPTQAPQTPAPTAPAQAQQQPEQGPLTKVDFENSPIASIGLILEAFGAGLLGKESPVTRNSKLAIAREGQNLRRAGNVLKAVEIGRKQMKGASPEEAADIVKSITNISAEAGAILEDVLTRTEEEAERILNYFESPEGQKAAPWALEFAESVGTKPAMDLFREITQKKLEAELLRKSEEADAFGVAKARAEGKAAGTPKKEAEEAQTVEIVQGGSAAAKKLGLPNEGTYEVTSKGGQLSNVSRIGQGGTTINIELPDPILLRKAVMVETTARNFIGLVKETLTFLQNPKTVLGATGTGLRFAQGLKAQASQLATAFSGDHFDGATAKPLTVSQILDPNRYTFDGLQAIAAANVRVKANAIAMAYMVARSRDPSGRLSDFDVQSALESLGFQSNDKDIIAATLSDRLREVTGNAANFIQSVKGERPVFDVPPAAVTQPAKPITLEELEAIANGRT